MPRNPSQRRSPAQRIAIALVAVAAITFAVQGGEWGTFDLLSQSRRMEQLTASVDSLQRVVDSLKVYRKRLDTDPTLQERIAREEFGMVRGNKELLYRFTEPVSKR